MRYILILLFLSSCLVTVIEEPGKPSEIYCRARKKHVEWCRSEVARCKTSEENEEVETGTVLVVGRDCGST